MIKEFLKKLFSENPEISSMRVSLIMGLILVAILEGIFILISLESKNWGFDLSILDRITVLVGVLLGSLVTGKIV